MYLKKYYISLIQVHKLFGKCDSKLEKPIDISEEHMLTQLESLEHTCQQIERHALSSLEVVYAMATSSTAGRNNVLCHSGTQPHQWSISNKPTNVEKIIRSLLHDDSIKIGKKSPIPANTKHLYSIYTMSKRLGQHCINVHSLYPSSLTSYLTHDPARRYLTVSNLAFNHF